MEPEFGDPTIGQGDKQRGVGVLLGLQGTYLVRATPIMEARRNDQ